MDEYIGRVHQDRPELVMPNLFAQLTVPNPYAIPVICVIKLDPVNGIAVLGN